MWDLPRPGIKPVSPALAGGFLTTAPPGKPYFLFFKIFIYLYKYVCMLHRVSVVACGLLVAACGLLVAARGLLLSCGMHAGSSSPTRDRTRAPCIGSMESYPLDHQGSPSIILIFNYLFSTSLQGCRRL